MTRRRAVERAHGIGGPAQVEQPERKGVEWLPIETAPDSEAKSFLVKRPAYKWCGIPEHILQVNRFEGVLYPDHLGDAVDPDDAVNDATHWAPLPAGTNTTEGA